MQWTMDRMEEKIVDSATEIRLKSRGWLVVASQNLADEQPKEIGQRMYAVHKSENGPLATS